MNENSEKLTQDKCFRAVYKKYRRRGLSYFFVTIPPNHKKTTRKKSTKKRKNNKNKTKEKTKQKTKKQTKKAQQQIEKIKENKQKRK